MFSDCFDIPTFTRWEAWEAAWPNKKQAARVHEDYLSRFGEFEKVIKAETGLEKITYSYPELLQVLELVPKHYAYLSGRHLNEFCYPREVIYYSLAWYIGQYFGMLFGMHWASTVRHEMNFPFPKVQWKMDERHPGFKEANKLFYTQLDYFPFHQIGLVIKKGQDDYLEYIKAQVDMIPKFYKYYQFPNNNYLHFT